MDRRSRRERETETGMKLKLEIDLASEAITSVSDLAETLRSAGDSLLAMCGADCEFTPHCRHCWTDLILRDEKGNVAGSATFVLE